MISSWLHLLKSWSLRKIRGGSEPTRVPDITDAAVLMAADGYGSGKAVGTEGDHEVVVRTSESQKSFLFEKEPEPESLAKIAQAQFERVSTERDMKH